MKYHVWFDGDEAEADDKVVVEASDHEDAVETVVREQDKGDFSDHFTMLCRQDGDDEVVAIQVAIEVVTTYRCERARKRKAVSA